LKEQYKSATEGLTEEQIARAQKRTEHGNRLYIKAMATTSADWLHHSECRAKLTRSERSTFDLAFVKARAVAGVRPAVDLALSEMRKRLMLRLGRGRWEAIA
jgi:hypothetical protein